MPNLAITLFLGVLIGIAFWLKKPLLLGLTTMTAFAYCCWMLYQALMKIYELLSSS